MVSFVRPLALAAGLALAGAAPALAQHHGQHAPDSAHARHGAGAPAPAAHGAHSSGWRELDAYHAVMMGSWHPARASNDLGPARTNAFALARSAEQWAASTPPERCAGPETEEAVARVAADSKAFAALVERKASDDDVKAALAALHDSFETVMHACAAEH
jgi:hypothetical protein